MRKSIKTKLMFFILPKFDTYSGTPEKVEKL